MPAPSKEPIDDGRRCRQCGAHNTAAHPLVRWMIADRRHSTLRGLLGVDDPPQYVDMHHVCVGSWLTSNEGQRHGIAFAPGIVTGPPEAGQADAFSSGADK